MGGVAGGFNPADTLLVAVKYHPIRVQPGFALNQFDSAGVNGRSGAFIQAGRICTDLYGDIGIQVECRCRGRPAMPWPESLAGRKIVYLTVSYCPSTRELSSRMRSLIQAFIPVERVTPKGSVMVTGWSV